jgi:hypothetical protein
MRLLSDWVNAHAGSIAFAPLASFSGALEDVRV